MKKPGTSGEGAGGQAIPIPQPPQGGSGGGGDGGMDWIGSSMGQMQIKRDSEGQLKQPQQGSISAMGVKGVAGAVPGAEGAPDASRARVLEFLQRHTAYELIPESNKVVVLDTELPVRRAFHACFEQGIMAAPLWDERRREFVGMLSAGDFIDITQIVGSSLANTSVSEAELDAHTIAAVRAEQAAETGRAPAPLVSVRPEDSLHLVSLTLMQGRLALAPVLSYGAHVPRGQTPSASAAEMGEAGSGTGGETPQTGGSRADANDAASPSHRRDGGSSSGGASGGGGMPGARPLGAPQLLHLTNLAEVLACLVRHFRGVPSALPLFSQPVGALPLGTWTAALGGFRGSQRQPGGGGNPSAGVEGAPRSAAAAAASAGTPAPQLLPIKAILPSSTVADAFRMMPGCGALPVVDEAGRLVDVYARADVILLAANNTYRRVALNEFTVAQALAAGRNPQREAAAAQQAAMHAAAAAAQGAQAAGAPPPHARNPGLPSPRAHTHARGHAEGGGGGAEPPGRAAARRRGRRDGRRGGRRESLGRRRVLTLELMRRRGR